MEEILDHLDDGETFSIDATLGRVFSVRQESEATPPPSNNTKEIIKDDDNTYHISPLEDATNDVGEFYNFMQSIESTDVKSENSENLDLKSPDKIFTIGSDGESKEKLYDQTQQVFNVVDTENQETFGSLNDLLDEEISCAKDLNETFSDRQLRHQSNFSDQTQQDLDQTITTIGEDSVFNSTVIGDETFENAFEHALEEIMDDDNLSKEWTSDYESDNKGSNGTSSFSKVTPMYKGSKISEKGTTSVARVVGDSKSEISLSDFVSLENRTPLLDSHGSSVSSEYSNTEEVIDGQHVQTLCGVPFQEIILDTNRLTEEIVNEEDSERILNDLNMKTKKESTVDSKTSILKTDELNIITTHSEHVVSNEELFHSPGSVCPPTSPTIIVHRPEVSLAKTQKIQLISSELNNNHPSEAVEANQEVYSEVNRNATPISNDITKEGANLQFGATNLHRERKISMDEMSEGSTMSSIDEFIPETEEPKAPPEVYKQAYNAAIQVAQVFQHQHVTNPCFQKIIEDISSSRESLYISDGEGSRPGTLKRNQVANKQKLKPTIEEEERTISGDSVVKSENVPASVNDSEIVVSQDQAQKFLQQVKASTDEDNEKKNTKQLTKFEKDDKCYSCNIKPDEGTIVKSEEVSTQEVTLIFAWPKGKMPNFLKANPNEPFRKLHMHRVMKISDSNVKMLEGPSLQSITQAKKKTHSAIDNTGATENSSALVKSTKTDSVKEEDDQTSTSDQIIADIDVKVKSTKFVPKGNSVVMERQTKEESRIVENITEDIVKVLSKNNTVECNNHELVSFKNTESSFSSHHIPELVHSDSAATDDIVNNTCCEEDIRLYAETFFDLVYHETLIELDEELRLSSQMVMDILTEKKSDPLATYSDKCDGFLGPEKDTESEDVMSQIALDILENTTGEKFLVNNCTVSESPFPNDFIRFLPSLLNNDNPPCCTNVTSLSNHPILLLNDYCCTVSDNYNLPTKTNYVHNNNNNPNYFHVNLPDNNSKIICYNKTYRLSGKMDKSDKNNADSRAQSTDEIIQEINDIVSEVAQEIESNLKENSCHTQSGITNAETQQRSNTRNIDSQSKRSMDNVITKQQHVALMSTVTSEMYRTSSDTDFDLKRKLEQINKELDELFPRNRMYSSLQELGTTQKIKARSKRLSLSETLLENLENEVRKATSQDEISTIIDGCTFAMEDSIRESTDDVPESPTGTTTPENIRSTPAYRITTELISSNEIFVSGKPKASPSVLHTIHEGTTYCKKEPPPVKPKPNISKRQSSNSYSNAMVVEQTGSNTTGEKLPNKVSDTQAEPHKSNLEKPEITHQQSPILCKQSSQKTATEEKLPKTMTCKPQVPPRKPKPAVTATISKDGKQTMSGEKTPPPVKPKPKIVPHSKDVKETSKGTLNKGNDNTQNNNAIGEELFLNFQNENFVHENSGDVCSLAWDENGTAACDVCNSSNLHDSLSNTPACSDNNLDSEEVTLTPSNCINFVSTVSMKSPEQVKCNFIAQSHLSVINKADNTRSKQTIISQSHFPEMKVEEVSFPEIDISSRLVPVANRFQEEEISTLTRNIETENEVCIPSVIANFASVLAAEILSDSYKQLEITLCQFSANTSKYSTNNCNYTVDQIVLLTPVDSCSKNCVQNTRSDTDVMLQSSSKESQFANDNLSRSGQVTYLSTHNLNLKNYIADTCVGDTYPVKMCRSFDSGSASTVDQNFSAVTTTTSCKMSSSEPIIVWQDDINSLTWEKTQSVPAFERRSQLVSGKSQPSLTTKTNSTSMNLSQDSQSTLNNSITWDSVLNMSFSTDTLSESSNNVSKPVFSNYVNNTMCSSQDGLSSGYPESSLSYGCVDSVITSNYSQQELDQSFASTQDGEDDATSSVSTLDELVEVNQAILQNEKAIEKHERFLQKHTLFLDQIVAKPNVEKLSDTTFYVSREEPKSGTEDFNPANTSGWYSEEESNNYIEQDTKSQPNDGSISNAQSAKRQPDYSRRQNKLYRKSLRVEHLRRDSDVSSDSDVDYSEYKTYISDDLLQTDIDGAEVAQYAISPGVDFYSEEITACSSACSVTDDVCSSYDNQTDVSDYDLPTERVTKPFENVNLQLDQLNKALDEEESNSNVEQKMGHGNQVSVVNFENITQAFNDKATQKPKVLLRSKTWNGDEYSSKIHNEKVGQEDPNISRHSLVSPSFSPTTSSAFSVRDDEYAKRSRMYLKQKAEDISNLVMSNSDLNQKLSNMGRDFSDLLERASCAKKRLRNSNEMVDSGAKVYTSLTMSDSNVTNTQECLNMPNLIYKTNSLDSGKQNSNNESTHFNFVSDPQKFHSSNVNRTQEIQHTSSDGDIAEHTEGPCHSGQAIPETHHPKMQTTSLIRRHSAGDLESSIQPDSSSLISLPRVSTNPDIGKPPKAPRKSMRFVKSKPSDQ